MVGAINNDTLSQAGALTWETPCRAVRVVDATKIDMIQSLTWEPPWEAPCRAVRVAWRHGSSTNSVEMARKASCMAGGR